MMVSVFVVVPEPSDPSRRTRMAQPAAVSEIAAVDSAAAADNVVTVIEVAKLPPGACGGHIVGTFERLAPGEALEVVVGHDPAPLRQRFAVERPGASAWTYLERGPDVWRVRVQRLA
jgi:uncharacterized protein (DUF2249 family)